MWKIDTGKTTMLALMKPYQHGIISMMQEKQDGVSSGDIHAALEMEGFIISRASVINYMQLLAANDVLSYEEKPGKGGYARFYSVLMDWESLIEFMHMRALATLSGAFPESKYLKETVGLLSR